MSSVTARLTSTLRSTLRNGPQRARYDLSVPVDRRSLVTLGPATSQSHSTSFKISHIFAVAALTTTGCTLAYTRARADVQAAHVHKTPLPSDRPPLSKSTSKPIDPESQDLLNWSATHQVTTSRYFQPETIDELKAIVNHAHQTRQKLRPVGSALSPNGLSFSPDGMINLANMDAVLNIDTKNCRVTVQAGARVSQVVDALRPHGLTLQNFASITEQQIGGFTQVGAHGTGVTIPPADEQVVAIRLVTPAAGELYLSADDDDPSLFQLARLSLGLMGVVAEVTLQCVPAHKLKEQTIVLKREDISKYHRKLLDENRHLRYMWIPYTDDVVVVTCNLAKLEDVPIASPYSNSERLAPARELLLSHPKCKLSKEEMNQLHFMSLRDELIMLDPLNAEWIKKVNSVEATFWRRSQGTCVDWSDRILQFDCGGQQWVNEVAFPVSKRSKGTPDVQFMYDFLQLIEEEKLPAPSPIEQRWSAPSLSPLSPASEKPEQELADFYSWVGIIMYLPNSEEHAAQRAKIAETFKTYKRLGEEKLWPDVKAVEHWAKIEIPASKVERVLLQQRTAQKYPTEAFKGICGLFDPHGILRNELTDTIFDMPLS